MAGMVERLVPMEWNGQMIPLGRHLAHTGTVTSLTTIRSDGDVLLSSSEDKTTVLWRIAKKNNQVCLMKRQSLEGHSQTISDACFASKGSQVVLAGGDKLLYLYDLNYPTMPQIFQGHQKGITSVHIVSNRWTRWCCRSMVLVGKAVHCLLTNSAMLVLLLFPSQSLPLPLPTPLPLLSSVLFYEYYYCYCC